MTRTMDDSKVLSREDIVALLRSHADALRDMGVGAWIVHHPKLVADYDAIDIGF